MGHGREYARQRRGSAVKDLTNSSIAKNILYMALPIAAGMIFQTLYFLIDLYFVGGLGAAALAGVGAAGNVTMIVMAVTQVLGVGTVTLISHAAGRKDQADATLVFNQSLVMSASCGVLALLLGYGASPFYMGTLGSDPATVAAGISYLHWYLPSLGLQFAVVAMGSALRGTGIVRPTMTVQVLSVVLNAVLAPVLIAGWGTGHPLGVAGAGLASSLSLAVGTVMLGLYFHRLEKYVGFDARLWRPQFATWRRLLRIGLPAGGEFALMFIIMAVMYWIIRPFGEDAQAGFGIGTRMMQCMFLPAMAVAFATAPIVGQNYAAGKYPRVRETFAPERVDRQLLHGLPDDILSLGLGVGGRRIYQGRTRNRRRRAVPAGGFVEFSGEWFRVHVFGGISRARQHGALGIELGEPADHIRRAGAVAGFAAAFRVDSSVVCVGRQRCPAGDFQFLAGAPGIETAITAGCRGCYRLGPSRRKTS